jgi:hypothetical protein
MPAATSKPNTTIDPQGFMITFLDGPLAHRGNVPSAQPGHHAFVVSSGVWTWPLPQRMATLSHLAHATNVAMWDADDLSTADGLPDAIVKSPNVIVYRKVSESQLPRGTEYVLRGAAYQVE